MFEEVVAGIDLRITISSIGSGHVYNGLVPNRNPASPAPAGDLGIYYTSSASGTNTGGISMTFSFFQSDNTRNNITQLATPVTREFSLVLYDVDGESSQNERVRASYQDGLRSYQLSQTGAMAVSNTTPGIYTFSQGSGAYDETTGPMGSTPFQFLRGSASGPLCIGFRCGVISSRKSFHGLHLG